MKVLLTTLNSKYIHINLAIRLLYHLNKDKHNVSYKEFTIKEKQDDAAKFCTDYDVIAFSCYIWNITPTLEVAAKIKALNPNIKILLGGPEVSYDWKETMALPQVDYIITGEGEIPFGLFLDTYPNTLAVGNLAQKKSDGTVHYLPQNLDFDISNYDTIMPYENDNPEELSKKVCYIETSRGCPYKCEFCLASLDNKVRYLGNSRIKENLLYLMQHGKVVKFLDRTFNIKKDFTIDIFKFILAHYKPGNVFQFEITADIVHPDIIAFVQEHVPPGIFRFEIGIQTVNQQANLQVSRKQNFEKTKQVILQLQDKIEMHLDLIVGLPLDYFDDIKYSFEEVFKLFPPELQLGFLKFLKGTPVRQKYESHGYKFDPNPPYQIIESNYTTKEELAQIERLEEALEIYWNKKRAINTLKYVSLHYSIFDFLCGLANYFETKSDFHKHSLADIYVILNEYLQLHYSDNKELLQLAAIDYYLAHKVKPKNLFLNEIDSSLKTDIIQEKNLNLHKFRYLMFPIDFDYQLFSKKQIIEKKSNTLILKYTGVSAVEVVS